MPGPQYVAIANGAQVSSCFTLDPPGGPFVIFVASHQQVQVSIDFASTSGGGSELNWHRYTTPAGNAFVTIERVAGIISAPPIPCTTRLATSDAVSGARPAEAEASVNRVTPIRKVRRRPKMSPRRPPVASSTAKASV